MNREKKVKVIIKIEEKNKNVSQGLKDVWKIFKNRKFWEIPVPEIESYRDTKKEKLKLKRDE